MITLDMDIPSKPVFDVICRLNMVEWHTLASGHADYTNSARTRLWRRQVQLDRRKVMCRTVKN